MSNLIIELPGIFLTAIAAPSLVELSGLTMASWLIRPRQIPAPKSWPALAVVIPAHNEELLIARAVNSARSLAYPGILKVFVVADNCTDATAERASAAGAGVMVRQDATLRGKGHALNFAFRQLLLEPFEAFVVIDADSVVSENAAEEIGRRIGSGADAVQIRYEVGNAADTPHTRLVGLGFLAFNVVRPRGRAVWGFSSGITGNGFALSRQTLEAVPYEAFSIVEDLEYHLRLVRDGRSVQFSDAARVYGDMPSKRADSVQQRARWEGGRFQVAFRSLPQLFADIVQGRGKLVEPAMELLTMPLGYLVAVLLLLAAVPTAFSRIVSAVGFLIVTGHVVTAALAGDKPGRTLAAVFSVPKYLLWKLSTLSAIRHTVSRKAAWVRTTRGEL